MALLNFSGFESGGTLEFLATSGTFAVQSTTKRTGGYALQCNPTGSAVGFAALGGIASTGADGNFSATDLYYRFYFRYGTKPSSGDEPILQVRNGSTTVKFELRLNSSGQLVAYNQAITLLATGTTALAANTWYRISVRVGTGTTANWEAKIDGVSEISGTGDLTASVTSRVLLGKVVNRNSNTVNFYYDDTWADDAAYPGPGQCEVMQADGNGNYTAFRDETGTSQGQYTSVDELPPNTTVGSEDYVLSTLTTTDQSSFTLESASSAGVSGAINAVKAVVFVAKDGATNGNIKQLTRSGATDTLQAAVGSSAAYANISKTFATDPNTGSAWTSSALDALEVGLRENSTSNKTRCTAAYAMVDFTPPTTVTKTHTSDSLLLKTQTKVHTSDALLKGTSTKAHTTDAYLAAPSSSVAGLLPRIRYAAIKPPPGTQLDRSDPLSQGLQRLYALAEGGGTSLGDSASGSGLTTSNAPAWGTSPYGPKLAYNGTNQQATGSDNGLPTGTAPVTMAVLFRTTSSNANMCLIGYGQTAANNQNFHLMASGGVFKFGAVNGDRTGSVTINDGNWHLGVGIFSGGNLSSYVDGRPDVAPISTANSTVLIGSGGVYSGKLGTLGIWTDAEVAAAWIWNRELSASEVRQFSLAPFRNFAGPRRFFAIAGTSTVTKAHTTDALLKKTQVKTHTTDSLLKAVKTISQTTDSLLKGTLARTHTSDSLLKGTLTKAHTLDSLLKGTLTKSHTTDAYLASAGVTTITRTHATDALLKKTLQKSHTSDSLLLKSSTKAHTSDALLKAARTKVHTSDSLLKATRTTQHASDSLLKGTRTASHATDAYLSDGTIPVVNARIVARTLLVNNVRGDRVVDVGNIRVSRTLIL